MFGLGWGPGFQAACLCSLDFLKMGPLSLLLDFASLITHTHLQRSAEAQIMGQMGSVFPNLGRRAEWDGDHRLMVQGA